MNEYEWLPILDETGALAGMAFVESLRITGQRVIADELAFDLGASISQIKWDDAWLVARSAGTGVGTGGKIAIPTPTIIIDEPSTGG